MQLNNQLSKSRFITLEDSSTKFFVYDLPETWWSRFYEYDWCKNFIESNDVVLDAASGVIHPLKFYLADNCNEVFACDIDSYIETKDYNLLPPEYKSDPKIIDTINTEEYFRKTNNKCCSLTKMPYEDKKFDKIFCISVLEHLNDSYNSKLDAKTKKLPLSFNLFHTPKDIYKSLKEFKRILKDDGYLILTFDYPSINLTYLNLIIEKLNLCFVSEHDFSLPDNAIYSEVYGLYCYRAVIKKRQKA